MKSKIKIFESNRSDGIISRNKKFYSPEQNKEEIDKIFLETRIKLGKKYGFNGKKIFQATQKTENNNIEYPNGKYHIINDKDLTKEDFWYEELICDILIITKDYPNIVVGNQMADCPILIAEDRKKGVTALSHCGAAYIDRNLPIQTIEALQKSFNSNINDIYVYIGSCIRKENYIYYSYPRWAKNVKVWENAIIKEKNLYYIDMIKAITNQLQEIGINNIEISPVDTYKDPNYYSHFSEVKGETLKIGQNFVGFFYPNDIQS